MLAFIGHFLKVSFVKFKAKPCKDKICWSGFGSVFMIDKEYKDQALIKWEAEKKLQLFYRR